MQSLVTSVMFGKSSILCLCLPAECLLHQLTAAPLGSSEPDHRWRRQQVSGGREQQTAATGVQLCLYQAHEAHLDVQSGKTHTDWSLCARLNIQTAHSQVRHYKLQLWACFTHFSSSALMSLWSRRFANWFSCSFLPVPLGWTNAPWCDVGIFTVHAFFFFSLCPCVNMDHFPYQCLQYAFKSPSSWVG